LLSIDVAGPEKGQALANQLRESGAWLECVAGIDSVVVQFDAMNLDSSEARLKLEKELDTPRSGSKLPVELLEVPVCYGGEYGPDLEMLCASLNLSVDEIVKLHSGREYRVDMLGFTPGFAYIGGLDDALNVPRLKQPRQHVAAGSVGIADGRTGIYSLPGPGGWPIIGRTALSLFDSSAAQPFVLQAGARIRFRVVDAAEFESRAELS
jgi:KipI family sensor histidine kinase inhibitor